MNDINLKHINTLPFDVIINNIMPYTYKRQPTELLIDIRSYISDYSLVENEYIIHYNYQIFLNDLLHFCYINISPSYGVTNIFENVLRRNYSICKKSDDFLITFVIIHFHRNSNIHIESKIKLIWGLLNPIERTGFINKYILE
jgi:hypothetical protein